MSDQRLYSTRVLDPFARLISLRYPLIDISKILSHAGIAPWELADHSHWLTQEQVNRFYEKAAELTDNPNLAREAGDDAGLDDLLSHSITYRIAVGLQQGRKAFTFARRSHRVSVAGAQARTGRQRRNIRPCPGHSA